MSKGPEICSSVMCWRNVFIIKARDRGTKDETEKSAHADSTCCALCPAPPVCLQSLALLQCRLLQKPSGEPSLHTPAPGAGILALTPIYSAVPNE